jgi:hypothetical protein
VTIEVCGQRQGRALRSALVFPVSIPIAGHAARTVPTTIVIWSLGFRSPVREQVEEEEMRIRPQSDAKFPFEFEDF